MILPGAAYSQPAYHLLDGSPLWQPFSTSNHNADPSPDPNPNRQLLTPKPQPLAPKPETLTRQPFWGLFGDFDLEAMEETTPFRRLGRKGDIGRHKEI